ncbi:MAG: hypothetical protein JNN04_12405 [Cyclobacteriaceae bacterium]|nr:hypothetical protein [Cyclobacteriaceae bacterium]
MKTHWIVGFVLTAGVAYGQSTVTRPDSLFIVTYTLGPAWDANLPPSSQLHFKEHSANLGAWRKEGVIRFGARYADKGIIVITAPNQAALRERIGHDPAVSGGVFRADIQPLQPFFEGCIEKPK